MPRWVKLTLRQEQCQLGGPWRRTRVQHRCRLESPCQLLSDFGEHVFLLLTLHTRLVAGGRKRLISGLGGVKPVRVGVESCVWVASGHFECVYMWIECVETVV